MKTLLLSPRTQLTSSLRCYSKSQRRTTHKQTADTAKEAVKAQVLRVKADLVRETSAAVNVFVTAHTAGVDLPQGLTRLINCDV